MHKAAFLRFSFFLLLRLEILIVVIVGTRSSRSDRFRILKGFVVIYEVADKDVVGMVG